ncbi:MAG: hypothetical protein D6B25_07195 [Desulfobulbaceae bacterium]|nr:MAG: hypothetical protein D6B25_07195 [Desulfobulbaceae bacterium]
MIERYWDKLSSRERLLVLMGVIIVCAMLLHGLLLQPYLDYRSGLKSQIYTQNARFEQVEQLSREFQQLQSRQDEFVRQIEEETEGFSLFTFLEEAATVNQLRTQVSAMKPGQRTIDDGILESTVTMNLERVSLSQLVSLLLAIEYSDRKITIRDISIYRNKNDDKMMLLDVILKTAVVAVDENAIEIN